MLRKPAPARFLSARRANRQSRTTLLLALLALGVAGCATGDVAMLVTIASGEKVRVPMGRKGVEPTSADGVEIQPVRFDLDKEKFHLIYSFGFSDAKHRALRSVRVQDVTDAGLAPLVEQADATVEANGRWSAKGRSLSMSDPALKWLLSIENSARVFQFTIVFQDGHTLVLNQGAFFPNFVKAAVRHEFGEKY
jgi:hypothetical protein